MTCFVVFPHLKRLVVRSMISGWRVAQEKRKVDISAGCPNSHYTCDIVSSLELKKDSNRTISLCLLVSSCHSFGDRTH